MEYFFKFWFEFCWVTFDGSNIQLIRQWRPSTNLYRLPTIRSNFQSMIFLKQKTKSMFLHNICLPLGVTLNSLPSLCFKNEM